MYLLKVEAILERYISAFLILSLKISVYTRDSCQLVYSSTATSRSPGISMELLQVAPESVAT